MGGTYARLLSNLAVFIGAVKSNNRYIMQLWFASDERAERSTKGQGQMPLLLLPLQQCDCIIAREMYLFDVYTREVLVSDGNQIHFTHPSRFKDRLARPPKKTYNDYFF